MVSIRAMTGGGCTANARPMPRGRGNGRVCFRLTGRGTNLVQGAVVRSPPMLTDDPAVLVARANSSKPMDSELGVLVPICSGILHEFRNHLTLLSAATTEVRTVTSSPTIIPEILPEISQALMETESNVRRMTALMAFIDAAVRGGPPATVELDGVIERALRLVAPALGRVAVSFNKPQPHPGPQRGHGPRMSDRRPDRGAGSRRDGDAQSDLSPADRRLRGRRSRRHRSRNRQQWTTSGPGFVADRARARAGHAARSICYARRPRARGSSSGSIPAPSRANSRPSPWGWVSWPGTFLF